MPAVDQAGRSQIDYRPTEYQDCSWEVVNEAADGSQEFSPMAVEIFSSEEMVHDPMFADFGSTSGTKSAKRWHLPEHLAFGAASKSEEQEVQTARRALTEEEIQAIEAAAFERGRQSALVDAAQQQSERLANLEKRSRETFMDMARQLNEQQARLEQKAVELSINISRKIIDGAVEINPEYIVRIVREALNLIGGAAVRTVRVSPQDLEFIQLVGLGQHLKEFDGTWAFEADASIKAGCVVETSAGEIDFQLDSAWERVRDNVIRVMR